MRRLCHYLPMFSGACVLHMSHTHTCGAAHSPPCWSAWVSVFVKHTVCARRVRRVCVGLSVRGFIFCDMYTRTHCTHDMSSCAVAFCVILYTRFTRRRVCGVCLFVCTRFSCLNTTHTVCAGRGLVGWDTSFMLRTRGMYVYIVCVVACVFLLYKACAWRCAGIRGLLFFLLCCTESVCACLWCVCVLGLFVSFRCCSCKHTFARATCVLVFHECHTYTHITLCRYYVCAPRCILYCVLFAFVRHVHVVYAVRVV